MSDLERLPVVSVVGRPNVGKSTLFNRILGRREAIVEEKPGVTRDRKVLEAEWQGYRFELVDTGGWMPSGNELDDKVSAQSERAISDSDLIVLVVDGTTGVTEEDALIGFDQARCDHGVLKPPSAICIRDDKVVVIQTFDDGSDPRGVFVGIGTNLQLKAVDAFRAAGQHVLTHLFGTRERNRFVQRE